LIGAMQAIRILRIAPTIGALAFADSKTLLYANLGRATAFLGGLAATLAGAHMAWIAGAGVAAEVVATVIAVLCVQAKHGVRAGIVIRPAVFTLCGIAGAFALAGTGWLDGDVAALAGMAVYLLTVLGAAWVFFPRAAPMVRELIAARRNRKSNKT